MSRLFLIIAIIIFLSWNPARIFAHGEVFEVHVSTAGFSPQELTIEQGETVKFTNDGTEPHWPASDIHPTHKIYPEFDPKKAIEPGQSWAFTFTKVGSFRMHDHLFAENIGKITVTRNPEYKDVSSNSPSISDQIKSKISDLKIAFLKKYYSLFPARMEKILSGVDIHKIAAKNDETEIRYYLKLLGAKKVMDKLISDSGGGSIVDCHQEAHRIGRVAYELYGGEVFKEGNFNCHSGFIHGAMESFLQQKGTDNLSKNIENLCSIFPTAYGNFECLHGVGHGVMAFVDYDLPEGLETCKGLSTSFEQSSCYGGVFMENIVTAEGNGAGTAHKTKWVNSDPHFPCNAVSNDSDIQVQCYLMQTSRMLDISNYNFDFVTENCLTAPENMIATCFQSEGRDAAGQTLRDPVKIINICSKVPKENKTNCITGALNVIIEFWSDQMADKPHKLCKLVENPGDKNDCYSLLASRLSGIYGDNNELISQSCKYFELAYQSLCYRQNRI